MKNELKDASSEAGVKCLNSLRQTSALRQIRKSRNLSQRGMAKKMQITRTQLQRLESKRSEKLFLWELSLFAGALQVPLTDLVQIVGGEKPPQACVTRCSLGRPFTMIKFEEGVELDCLTENPKQYFVGRLSLSPQKSFPLKRLPGFGGFMFLIVLQGNACVEGGNEAMVLKERDGFFGENLSNFAIYNTQSVLKLSVLIFLPLIA